MDSDTVKMQKTMNTIEQNVEGLNVDYNADWLNDTEDYFISRAIAIIATPYPGTLFLQPYRTVDRVLPGWTFFNQTESVKMRRGTPDVMINDEDCITIML